MKFPAILAISSLLLAINIEQTHAAIDLNKLVCLVNQFRAKNNMPALSMDDSLNRAAQKHSDLQAKSNKMEHRLPGEGGLLERFRQQGGSWSSGAENIAFGYQTEDAVMNGWIKSPGHRANLLGRHTHIGHGMTTGNKNTKYWTQDFATDTRRKPNPPKC
ncbi:CAP domain-containing protein [Syncephalis fuscata]|nr:CAP domain-containing protein [Syncephalis fuscata]